jgi:hypothetical protein
MPLLHYTDWGIVEICTKMHCCLLTWAVNVVIMPSALWHKLVKSQNQEVEIMPKRYTMVDKRGWLAQYLEGKSEAEIAKTQKPKGDARTVKKGIEEARLEHEGQQARSELLKGALSRHHDSLLLAIDRMLGALVLPPHDLKLPKGGHASASPIQLSGARAEYSSPAGWTVILAIEDETEWELVAEHLKRDKMWKALGEWRKALSAHVAARVALRDMVVRVLQKKTGYPVQEKPGDDPYVSTLAAEVLYQTTINPLLGIPDGTDLEHNMVADTATGEIKHGSSILARILIGKEEEGKTQIISVIKELPETSQALSVITTYQSAIEATAKARRVVEEIRLLGMIPGKCRICKRLLGT